MIGLAEEAFDKDNLENLEKDFEEIKSRMKLLNHSLNKSDFLRVSNHLLASGRMADAASRRVFIMELSRWANTLEEIDEDDLGNFVENFQHMLRREHEKHLLDSRLVHIQNDAETGLSFSHQVAEDLRKLADEIEALAFPTLIPRMPTEEEEAAAIAAFNLGRKEAMAERVAAMKK